MGGYQIILIKTKAVEFYVSDFGSRENIYGFFV